MEAQHKFTTGDGLMLWGMFLFVLIMIDVLEPRVELYARATLAAVGVLSIAVAALRRAATSNKRGVGIACGAAALVLALGYGSPGTTFSLASPPVRIATLIIGGLCFLAALIFAVREALASSS
jgi:hypothetical protein